MLFSFPYQQICGNGVIQFDNERIKRWPRRFNANSPFRNRAMLAPYWSEVDTNLAFRNGPSKVFYHTYTTSDPGSRTVLLKATSDVSQLITTPLPTKFNASWVLVVTWENLRPKERSAHAPNLVSFNPSSYIKIHRLG